MAENTTIGWCDHTFNPWWGCQKVGPGCDFCYAERFDARTGGAHWGPHAVRRRTSEHNWNQPLRWNKRAASIGEVPFVFCASMADWADNAVPKEWRRDLFVRIRETPNLAWMLLTKRISNVDDMIEDCGGLPCNTGLGITVVNQEEADRDCPKLTALARHKPLFTFLSVEPMLGYVNLRGAHFDQVICGGESGPKRREMDDDWARDLRDQCARGGMAFYFKQRSGLLPKTDCVLDGREWKERPALSM